MAEDWHAKVCLMEVRLRGNFYSNITSLTSLTSNYQVIWKRLYHTTSGMERGTLYQLRNLINRRSVVKKVKSNVNACEDFLELVVTGYIVAGAMEVLGMSVVNDVPSSAVIDSPEDAWMQDDTERKSILTEVSSWITDRYVDLSTTFAESQQGQRWCACLLM